MSKVKKERVWLVYMFVTDSGINQSISDNDRNYLTKHLLEQWIENLPLGTEGIRFKNVTAHPDGEHITDIQLAKRD